MARKRSHKKSKKSMGDFSRLEVYAFWTGFASTLISLCQVFITASKL